MFHFFESRYEPGFILLSKIIANVIPRTAVTRNPNERQEVLFNEVTQGGLLFVLLPVTSLIADPIQALFSGVSRKLIRMQNSKALAEAEKTGGELLANKLKVAKLGKSLGASAFIASMLVGTTYLRNYRTIKRTGFSDYKKVVGLSNAKPTAEDKAKADQALAKNLRIMKGLAVGGAAAWLAIMGGAGLLARRGARLFKPGRLFSPQRLNDMMKHWAFVGKNSDQINGPFRSPWQTLVVWGIPSYLGWFLGCRDQYELIEQTSKFLTFLGGYFWTPKLVKRHIAQRHKELLAQAEPYGKLSYTTITDHIAPQAPELAKKLIRMLNTQWGLLTGVNFVVAGVLPLIFNIFFSKWRYLRDQKAGHSAGTHSAPWPKPRAPGGIHRKSIEEWGRPAPVYSLKPNNRWGG